MLLGAHISIAGGLARTVQRARTLRCEAVQIFSGSAMQWHSRTIDDREAELFRRQLPEAGVAAAMIHDSYLINLASPEPALLTRSRAAFAEEMRRADRLGVPYLVFHPGSDRGSGTEQGLRLVAEGLNELLETVPSRVTLLVENTAGQGNSLGHRLEHLATLLATIRPRRRFGVCLDTCHLHAAGYDLRTPRAYQATMREIEQLVGIERIKAFHLNDAKGELGCRVDRHAQIGAGKIGARAFGRLVRDERFDRLPGVLETPGGMVAFGENLRRLRRMRRRGRN